MLLWLKLRLLTNHQIVFFDQKMVQKQRQDTAFNALRMLPTKWAVIIVVAIIGYVLLQPQVNKWFGWSLPSVASLVGDEKKSTTKNQEKPSSNEKTRSAKADPKPSKAASGDDSRNGDSASKSTTSQPRVSDQIVAAERDLGKVHGYLTEIGRNRFESPAGLVYGPGAEEGHRLKHIEKHLEDQPKRPGSHGVFEGDMHAFLIAIDDAYSRAKSGAKGTKTTEDQGSTVYEASFKKPIGFLGGQEGGRKHNPPLKQLRVVVRGNSVITAFPFQ